MEAVGPWNCDEKAMAVLGQESTQVSLTTSIGEKTLIAIQLHVDFVPHISLITMYYVYHHTNELIKNGTSHR